MLLLWCCCCGMIVKDKNRSGNNEQEKDDEKFLGGDWNDDVYKDMLLPYVGQGLFRLDLEKEEFLKICGKIGTKEQNAITSLSEVEKNDHDTWTARKITIAAVSKSSKHELLQKSSKTSNSISSSFACAVPMLLPERMGEEESQYVYVWFDYGDPIDSLCEFGKRKVPTFDVGCVNMFFSLRTTTKDKWCIDAGAKPAYRVIPYCKRDKNGEIKFTEEVKFMTEEEYEQEFLKVKNGAAKLDAKKKSNVPLQWSSRKKKYERQEPNFRVIVSAHGPVATQGPEAKITKYEEKKEIQIVLKDVEGIMTVDDNNIVIDAFADERSQENKEMLVANREIDYKRVESAIVGGGGDDERLSKEERLNQLVDRLFVSMDKLMEYEQSYFPEVPKFSQVLQRHEKCKKKWEQREKEWKRKLQKESTPLIEECKRLKRQIEDMQTSYFATASLVRIAEAYRKKLPDDIDLDNLVLDDVKQVQEVIKTVMEGQQQEQQQEQQPQQEQQQASKGKKNEDIEMENTNNSPKLSDEEEHEDTGLRQKKGRRIRRKLNTDIVKKKSNEKNKSKQDIITVMRALTRHSPIMTIQMLHGAMYCHFYSDLRARIEKGNKERYIDRVRTTESPLDNCKINTTTLEIEYYDENGVKHVVSRGIGNIDEYDSDTVPTDSDVSNYWDAVTALDEKNNPTETDEERAKRRFPKRCRVSKTQFRHRLGAIVKEKRTARKEKQKEEQRKEKSNERKEKEKRKKRRQKVTRRRSGMMFRGDDDDSDIETSDSDISNFSTDDSNAKESEISDDDEDLMEFTEDDLKKLDIVKPKMQRQVIRKIKPELVKEIQNRETTKVTKTRNSNKHSDENTNDNSNENTNENTSENTNENSNNDKDKKRDKSAVRLIFKLGYDENMVLATPRGSTDIAALSYASVHKQVIGPKRGNMAEEPRVFAHVGQKRYRTVRERESLFSAVPRNRETGEETLKLLPNHIGMLTHWKSCLLDPILGPIQLLLDMDFTYLPTPMSYYQDTTLNPLMSKLPEMTRRAVAVKLSQAKEEKLFNIMSNLKHWFYKRDLIGFNYQFPLVGLDLQKKYHVFSCPSIMEKVFGIYESDFKRMKDYTNKREQELSTQTTTTIKSNRKKGSTRSHSGSGNSRSTRHSRRSRTTHSTSRTGHSSHSRTRHSSSHGHTSHGHTSHGRSSRRSDSSSDNTRTILYPTDETPLFIKKESEVQFNRFHEELRDALFVKRVGLWKFLVDSEIQPTEEEQKQGAPLLGLLGLERLPFMLGCLPQSQVIWELLKQYQKILRKATKQVKENARNHDSASNTQVILEKRIKENKLYESMLDEWTKIKEKIVYRLELSDENEVEVVNVRRYVNDCIQIYKQKQVEYEQLIEQGMIIEGRLKSLYDGMNTIVTKAAKRVVCGVQGANVRFNRGPIERSVSQQSQSQRPQRPQATMQVKMEIARQYQQLFGNKQKKDLPSDTDIAQLSSAVITDLEKSMPTRDVELVLRAALQIATDKKRPSRCAERLMNVEKQFYLKDHNWVVYSKQRTEGRKAVVYEIGLLALLKECCALFSPSFADFDSTWQRTLTLTRTILNVISSELKDAIKTIEIVSMAYYLSLRLTTFGTWMEPRSDEEFAIVKKLQVGMDGALRIIRQVRMLLDATTSIENTGHHLGNQVSELDLTMLVNIYRSISSILDAMEKHGTIHVLAYIFQVTQEQEVIDYTPLTNVDLLSKYL